MISETLIPPPDQVQIRHHLNVGDISQMIYWHAQLYYEEYGFDWTFESYVAQTFGELAERDLEGADRIWLAETNQQWAGSVAILKRADRQAQLRWLLVHPAARGKRLGRYLFEQALQFCRLKGYHSLYLLTAADLGRSAQMYQEAGFQLVMEKPQFLWGKEIVEQRFEINL